MKKYSSLTIASLLLISLSSNSQTFQESLKCGKEAIEAKKPKEAINYLNKAIQSNPKSAEAYYYRGLAHKSLNKKEDAISDFSEAITLDPKYVDAYTQRGYTQFFINRKGIDDLEHAIELDPSNLKALGYLGMLSRVNGEYSKAITLLSRVCELNPKDWYTRAELAKILACSPDEKIRDGKKALGYAKNAYELAKHNELFWPAVESLAMSYAELSDFEEAIKWQKKRIEMEPKDSNGEVISELSKKTAEARLKLYMDHKPLRFMTSDSIEWDR
jgi:tetratricopeptide (TPR) repeat protein